MGSRFRGNDFHKKLINTFKSTTKKSIFDLRFDDHCVVLRKQCLHMTSCAVPQTSIASGPI